MSDRFTVLNLGRISYEAAYEEQQRHLERVLACRQEGGTEGDVGRLLLLEHVPPVITVSRRASSGDHLLADSATLERAGVEVQPTNRGGDITYHGPGQLVAYPILDLNKLRLRLHDYMRWLESIVIDVMAEFGIEADRDAEATGVWTSEGKICALGVRVRRWITMHGLAINVDPDMRHFDLIVPCGLAGRSVTSMAGILGDRRVSMLEVKHALANAFQLRVRARLAELSA